MNHIDFYKAKLTYETDSWDVNEAIIHGDNIVIIDTRTPATYHTEHIPTAINIPHKSIFPSSTAHLDTSALYITYCDGIGCNASTKGALKMAELGFTVKELLGGLDWWVRDGYATHGKKARVATNVECGC